MPPPVQVGAASNGTVTYLVDMPPDALPPVRGRDIEAAWDAARGAQGRVPRGAARLFRFRRADGSFTDLALADPDARRWARALDGLLNLRTCYGLSTLLRLLALVDVLGRVASPAALRAGAGALNPALLRAAATAPLTADARFDETGFRARLPGPMLGPVSGPMPAHAAGVPA